MQDFDLAGIAIDLALELLGILIQHAFGQRRAGHVRNAALRLHQLALRLGPGGLATQRIVLDFQQRVLRLFPLGERIGVLKLALQLFVRRLRFTHLLRQRIDYRSFEVQHVLRAGQPVGIFRRWIGAVRLLGGGDFTIGHIQVVSRLGEFRADVLDAIHHIERCAANAARILNNHGKIAPLLIFRHANALFERGRMPNQVAEKARDPLHEQVQGTHSLPPSGAGSAPVL